MQKNVSKTTASDQQSPDFRIIRLPEVQRLTSLSVATLYRLIARGDFPQSIPLGGRSVGWLLGEIEAWVLQRVEQSRRA
ncbi:MAG: AlpA family transcriptional regulator [Magnetococcales bacterium]|nr:AlpA family transcriptional regulator [Magnetococcales bacterium]